MSDQHPDPQHPGQPAGQPVPRPEWENTNPYALGPMPTEPPPGHEATQTLPAPAPPAPARRRSGAFSALVVAAALVVGTAGGVGGAAAWSALDDDPTASSQASAPVTSSSVAADGDDEPAADGTVEQVASTVLPSVVMIEVSGGQQSGSGSGIVISSDGQILTNEHVASLADGGGDITISFNDGTKASATVLGTDPLTDTAVLQAEDVSGLTPATIGSSDGLDVGEQVVAIGSPFGLDATVTSGIVSALARPVEVASDGQGNTTAYPAIQTDAAINPGNSGGPLVDMDGNVVGINSSIYSSSSAAGGESGSIGLGFAIPIDEVMPIVEEMSDGETPTHARLGVSVSSVATGSGADSVEGARIETIEDGSTAADAGLQRGDVITQVDDTEITASDALVATIRAYRPGDTVTVTYLRDGQEQTAELELDSDANVSNS